LNNLKVRQRTQVAMEFGILIQPLVELIESSSPPPQMAYRTAIAKIQAGDAAWRRTVKDFATFANDLFFSKEFQELSHVNEIILRNFGSVIGDSNYIGNPDQLQVAMKKGMADYKRYFEQKLELIPIEWEPEIFAANTPFTAYLKIKEAISTTRARLDYFDRYLKIDFFHLFLEKVDRSTPIRLVTTNGNSKYGVLHVSPVSNLVRQEFSDYQLIEINPTLMHDRNLRIDSTIFSLGPGIDRAGMALTNFGPSDCSPTAQAALDSLIAQGTIIHRS
jgi:hypothetical protein